MTEQELAAIARDVRKIERFTVGKSITLYDVYVVRHLTALLAEVERLRGENERTEREINSVIAQRDRMAAQHVAVEERLRADLRHARHASNREHFSDPEGRMRLTPEQEATDLAASRYLLTNGASDDWEPGEPVKEAT